MVPIVAMLHGDSPLTPAQVRAGPAQSGPGYEIVVEYPGNVDPVTLGRAAERLAGLDEVASVHVVR